MRMPGVPWHPLAANWNKQPRMTAHDFVCIHTMVGSLVGTERWFGPGNGPGYAGTESHYGTGGDGSKVQWQDTRYQADANANGNGEVISIENADIGPEFPAWNINDPRQIPAFTDRQVRAIAEILAWECSPAAHADCPPSWACHQHGIPLELVPDTRPGRRGVAYHRQGVDPYRVPGGVLWSSAYAKQCPGDRRIRQITTEILPLARDLMNGEDMANVSDDQLATLLEAAEQMKDFYRRFTGPYINGGDGFDALRELQRVLCDNQYPRLGVTEEDAVQEAALVNLARYADGNALEASRAAVRILEALDELKAAVAALAGPAAPPAP